MFLKLKDQTGATILINNGPGPWTHIAQAADAQTKSPLLGYAVVFFGTKVGEQVGILIKGSPDDIAAQIEAQGDRFDKFTIADEVGLRQ